MAWHSDAEQRETDSSCHFHVNQRQRDRNSQPAIQNIIEERIPRIVVVIAIPSQSFLLEQNRVQGVDCVGSVANVASAAGNPLGQRFNPAHVGFDVEVGVFRAGNGKRGPQEVDALLVHALADQASESFGELDRAARHSSIVTKQRLLGRTEWQDGFESYRKRFFNKNNRLAGLSARRRIK